MSNTTGNTTVVNATVVNTTSTVSSAGIIWLKLAALYLVVGIALGIAMGASENFVLQPVHAHINLLGWATLALSGLIYSVFPQAGQNRLAKLHFWLLNLSLPVMMAALTLLVLGNKAVIPVLGISEIVSALAVLAFVVNIFTNLKSA
jgi:hypothetical protein